MGCYCWWWCQDYHCPPNSWLCLRCTSGLPEVCLQIDMPLSCQLWIHLYWAGRVCSKTWWRFHIVPWLSALNVVKFSIFAIISNSPIKVIYELICLFGFMTWHLSWKEAVVVTELWTDRHNFWWLPPWFGLVFGCWCS